MISNRWHYNSECMIQVLKDVGIKKGDTVFSHISLGRLGYPEEGRTQQDACSVLYHALIEVTGSSGTILIPTYTYSLGRREIFDINNTPSTIGPFTEFFRSQPGVIRSREPMLAVSGIGSKALSLLKDLPNTSYGKDSLYDRMKTERVKICTIGLSLYWATFRHHIEEMAKVPFRFNKKMTALINDNGVITKENWIYFAAPFTSNCRPNGIPLEIIAKETGIVSSAPIGLSSINCVDSSSYYSLGMEEFKKNPWLTAKGPVLSMEELETLEDKRVGVKEKTVNFPIYESIDTIIADLMKLPLDQVSWGYDTALQILNSITPIQIHKFSSGTETSEGIIPEKWVCHYAYLKKKDGTIIFSSNDNPCHVASYSLPFEGMVTREELFAHLFVDEQKPDEIPYVYLYDYRDWGLSCSQTQKDMLIDEMYNVVINTSFSYGSLKIGEISMPGKGDDEILFVGTLTSRTKPLGLYQILAGIEILKDFLQKQKAENPCRMLIFPDGGYKSWGNLLTETVKASKIFVDLSTLMTKGDQNLKSSTQGNFFNTMRSCDNHKKNVLQIKQNLHSRFK